MAVWELAIACDPSLADRAGAALLEAGASAIEEREAPNRVVLVVWTDKRQELETFERAMSRLGLSTEIRELDDAWRTEWMRHLRQERVSDGFVLQPLTDPTEPPPGTTRLVFDPAQAFGVGSHATTRLAARAVERACRSRAPASVLDVGTGNGVLALIAARSGARSVTGIDLDPHAIDAALHNAELNAVSHLCSFGATPLADVGRQFELVVANVELPVQIELARELGRVLAPGASLILTGFLLEHAERVKALHALSARSQEHEDEWCLLELDNPAKSC